MPVCRTSLVRDSVLCGSVPYCTFTATLSWCSADGKWQLSQASREGRSVPEVIGRS